MARQKGIDLLSHHECRLDAPPWCRFLIGDCMARKVPSSMASCLSLSMDTLSWQSAAEERFFRLLGRNGLLRFDKFDERAFERNIRRRDQFCRAAASGSNKDAEDRARLHIERTVLLYFNGASDDFRRPPAWKSIAFRPLIYKYRMWIPGILDIFRDPIIACSAAIYVCIVCNRYISARLQ